MCDPITLGVASFAIGAAQSIIGFVGAAQDASNAREAAVKENAENQNQLTLRQAQEEQAAAAKRQEQNLREAEAAADVEVGAASAGVAGISLDSILTDVGRRAANNRSAISENSRMAIAQISQEKRASVLRAEGKVAAAKGPNPLSLVAGIGAAALGGYNTYNKGMTEAKYGYGS